MQIRWGFAVSFPEISQQMESCPAHCSSPKSSRTKSCTQKHAKIVGFAPHPSMDLHLTSNSVDNFLKKFAFEEGKYNVSYASS
jgi:hypothetical protein